MAAGKGPRRCRTEGISGCWRVPGLPQWPARWRGIWLQHADEVRSLTVAAARALLEKDLLYREWSILHGGVYVPKSAPAEAGATARDEEREIVTPSGQTLTLLNPAVVSRQVFELQEQQTGIRGHLTSLKPLRPANRPDDWERQALHGL